MAKHSTEYDRILNSGPWTVTDNSGSITGHGWRLSATGQGFEVFGDHQLQTAEDECVLRNGVSPTTLRMFTPTEQDRIMRLSVERVRDDYKPGGRLSLDTKSDYEATDQEPPQ